MINPELRTATRLSVVYPSRIHSLKAPSEVELANLEHSFAERAQAAEIELMHQPPPAYASPETCRYCDVKQLCDVYWSANPTVRTHFTDAILVELTIVDGDERVWFADGCVTGQQPERVKIITYAPTSWSPATRMRIIDLISETDSDTGARTLRTIPATETYLYPTRLP